MRKFFHSIFLILTVILIAASNGVCFGQTPGNYVLRNDQLVRENAQIVVDSIFRGNDGSNQTQFVESVVKAFDRYWGKGKVNFDWKLLTKAQAQLDEVKSKVNYSDSLQSVLDKDLSHAKHIVLENGNESVSEAKVIEYLKNQIQQLRQTSDSLASQIEDSEKVLAQNQETVQQRTSQLETISSSGNELARAYIEADILLDLITRIQSGLTYDIASVKYNDIETAEDLYEEYIETIGIIAEDKYPAIVNGMAQITPYKELVNFLNDAVEEMSLPYDSDAVQMYAEEIQSLITEGRLTSSPTILFNVAHLTPTQKAKCLDTIEALKDMESSVKNLNYLLDYILKQNPDGIKSGSYEVTTDRAKVVNMVNPSQSRYNPLYTNLNNILDTIENDLKARNFSTDELGEYIQITKGRISK